jgi:predicted Zn-dependent protease
VPTIRTLAVLPFDDLSEGKSFGFFADGEMAAAIEAFEDAIRRQGHGRAQLGNLAYAYFKSGQPAKAQQYLDELEEQSTTRFGSHVLFAAIYFAAGDDSNGYAMLDSAVETRERAVIFLNVGKAFADQQGDPRFIAILDRVGL